MTIRLIKRWIKRFFMLLLVALITFMGIRIYDSQRGLRLEVWHKYVPDEVTAKKIDRMDFAAYLTAEQKVLDQVKTHVVTPLGSGEELTVGDVDGVSHDVNFDDKHALQMRWRDYLAALKPLVNPSSFEHIPLNRYVEGSVVYPGNFDHDWNRSYIMMPDGEVKGAVVLLHGLTDTPYSLRHIANHYRERGFVAIGIRLPAHGTVPAALSKVHWQDWLAATRLAVREAKRLSSPEAPLHLVGFSNGGALAMKYSLDALDNSTLAKPQQVILIAPMIGVTAFARFAGLAGLPAIFPPFAKAAWLSVLPEFNPFKYNSFPVNGARQSYLLTNKLQQQISQKSRENQLQDLPPILTFQSVVDFTVSTQAVINSLYNMLPANGSEVVLFDINRVANFDILIRSSTITAIDRLLPATPRNYKTTLITNTTKSDSQVVARTVTAGQDEEQVIPLPLSYPRQFFSLSHVAIPFPENDPLYGINPSNPTQYGVNLGSLAVRGERAVLVVDLDTLLRASSNPFFPYMLQRIDADIQESLTSPAQ